MKKGSLVLIAVVIAAMVIVILLGILNNRLQKLEDYSGKLAWAPSSDQLAFVCYRKPSLFHGHLLDWDYPTLYGNELKEICVVNTDGSKTIQLTQNYASDDEPTWSPDGSLIAFVSRRGGDADIYSMEADGSDQRILVHRPGRYESLPKWSPNGRHIAFLSHEANETEKSIYIADLESDRIERIRHSEGAKEFVWSPGGEFIAFIQHTHSSNDSSASTLSVVDRLKNDTVSQIAELGEYAPRHLSWSTNLTSIACVFNENGKNRVFVVEYPEGIVTRITETENNTTEYAPTWSPDGNSLAYIAVRSTGESLVIWNGSSHDTIANDVWIGGYQVLLPAWAPNGKHLSFYRSSDLDQDGFRTTKIWIVGSDGEGARRLLMSSPHSE